MPFALKKFISQFLMPMPLVCECFLLGWVLCRFTRYKKTGKCFILLAFTLFLLFGYGFGRTYLYTLERRYPAFDPTPEQCEALRGTPIVVLGQGMPAKSDLPVRYQNNPVFDRRLFEGVRVAKLIPESQLIVSMAGEASNSVKQAALDFYMTQLNFPTNRVSMFTTARDTSEEAKLAKQVISEQWAVGSGPKSSGSTNLSSRALPPPNGQLILPAATDLSRSPTHALMNSRTNELNNTLPRIVLATSASHIPRAMKIFQKQGLNPIASPCDYTDFQEPELERNIWYRWPMPTGKNVDHSERALYEWLGNLYESLF